jgi:hypothetical protein
MREGLLRCVHYAPRALVDTEEVSMLNKVTTGVAADMNNVRERASTEMPGVRPLPTLVARCWARLSAIRAIIAAQPLLSPDSTST